MKTIKIPKEAIKYVLFQRTGYLKDNYVFNLLSIFGYFNPFYKSSVSLKSFLFHRQIEKEFNADMVSEYLIIKPFLPLKITSLLDIGCGMAGIDILLSEHYANNIDIFLIDKTLINKKIYYHFKKKGAFYNSLQISKTILKNNDINSGNIYLQEATQDNRISFEGNFDMVISLISWGFHYPILTYLDEVYKKLKIEGILIVDIRKNSGGENEMKRKFGNYKIIFSSKTYLRVLARKTKGA